MQYINYEGIDQITAVIQVQKLNSMLEKDKTDFLRNLLDHSSLKQCILHKIHLLDIFNLKKEDNNSILKKIRYIYILYIFYMMVRSIQITQQTISIRILLTHNGVKGRQQVQVYCILRDSFLSYLKVTQAITNNYIVTTKQNYTQH